MAYMNYMAAKQARTAGVERNGSGRTTMARGKAVRI